MSHPTNRPAPEVLAALTPSLARRVFGAGVIMLLGALALWLAATASVTLGLRLLLVVPGMIAIGGAVRLWQVTALRIELTETELRDSAGTRLARIADVTRIDSSMLALKPSNGFVLRLAEKQPRGWAPGLWWRMGRHLGVGGITSAGEAKVMAEKLAILLARRGG